MWQILARMERNFRKQNSRESFNSQEVSCILSPWISQFLCTPRGALFLLRDGGANLRHSWQKEKCESESALGDTRRGYSVNCTPARLTLLREECRRGFACMIRYAAAIILLTVVLGRISYTAAITPSRYSSVEEAAVGRSV